MKTRTQMYSELIHFVAGDALDKMSTAEMAKLYNQLCGE